jgi:acyl carrier protein
VFCRYNPIPKDTPFLNDTSEIVRAFVTSNFYVAGQELANDASLLDSGVVDSTGVLEIIGFVETTFGVTVEDHEILPENLDSIERITAFVQRKKPSAP